MKKLLSVLSSTLQGGIRGGLLIFALLATSPLWASYSFQSGNLYYYIKNANEVTVTAANNTHSITIPRTVTYDSITYIVPSWAASVMTLKNSYTVRVRCVYQ